MYLLYRRSLLTLVPVYSRARQIPEEPKRGPLPPNPAHQCQSVSLTGAGSHTRMDALGCEIAGRHETPGRSGLHMAFLDCPMLTAPKEAAQVRTAGPHGLRRLLNHALVLLVGKLLCGWTISLLTAAGSP